VSNPVWMIVGGLWVLGLVAWSWPTLRQNVALLYFIQHVGTNLALGILFGRTLLSGRQPLGHPFRLACAQRHHFSRQGTLHALCDGRLDLLLSS
jgi:uncharacterized membrane protein